jgi:uncharacterized protein
MGRISSPAALAHPAREKFEAALDELVAQVKGDRSVLAAILCGSLSHDVVWAKSDIDLVLVTVDDKKAAENGLSLWADGINVHAILLARAEFRKLAESAIRSSFMHSLLAKGRLLYTHDDTIATLCSALHAIGERDTQLQLLLAGCAALPAIYKAHKFFLTRNDLNYAALWILHAAGSLARIEVISARLLADREVLPQALELNPSFFRVVYTDLLNTRKTRDRVQAALSAVDEYMANRAETLFAPVLDHLREVGEARSATEVDDHFRRNFGLEHVTAACEYLADQGLLGKAPVAVRLTKRSNVDVQELAFFYATKAADAG